MSNSLLRPDVLALIGALAGFAGPTDLAAAAPGAAPPGERDVERAGGSEAPPASRSVIACTLSSAEQRARRQAIASDLLPRVRAVTEEPTGYVLWFDRVEGELARIASFVELESQCCAFLDFAIRLDSGDGRIALHLAGPDGTKELLRPLVEQRP